MVISLPAVVEELITTRARAEGLNLDDYVERLLLEDEECREMFERAMPDSAAPPDESFNRFRARYARFHFD